MRTFVTSLPVGPYDWHEEAVPRSEAEARLAAVRAAMHRAAVAALVVQGNTLDDAALVWLTGFTPKLGPAYAFVPAEGRVRLLFSGGPGMKPSAAKLTWFDDLHALRAVESDLAAWLDEAVPALDLPVGVWSGDNLSETNLRAIERGAIRHGPVDVMGELDLLRRTKTPRERELVARAARVTREVHAAIAAAAAAGKSRHHAALAGEERGYALGAQDVRVLISQRAEGLPVPVEPGAAAVTPASNVYVAARHAGYWADFHAAVGGEAALARRAHASLMALLPELRAGWRPTARDDDLQVSLTGVGTGMRHLPLFDTGTRRQAGDTFSLRVDARDGDRVGIASCMVAIEEDGATMLSQPLAADASR